MLHRTSTLSHLLRSMGARLATALVVGLFLHPVYAQQQPKMQLAREDTVKAATDVPKTADGKVDTVELARIIAGLEERIRELETKLGKLSSAAASSSAETAGAISKPDDVAELKKEIAAIQEETKKNSSFLGFFRDVEVNGLVDGYYSFNFNRPDNNFNTGRNFDFRHNSLTLNYAEIAFEKKNDLANPLGFRLDLGFGPTADWVHGGDPAGGETVKHIQQAYVSYVAPIGNGLTIDFGKFVTPNGAEVIETKDNFNYSRSFLFSYAIPYYHTGLRAKYSFNGKVALTGFLVNGWDNLTDNNSGKTSGLSLALTPSSRLSIIQTYMAGPEQLGDSKHWRHLSDTVVSYIATDKLTLMANVDYGADQLTSGQKGHWKGVAGYFRYAFDKRLAFSPRFEVFNDHDGFRTGLNQTLKSMTLTQELKLANNLLTRFEYRRDWSDSDFFSKSVGRLVRGQNTVLIGLSYSISSRGQ